MSEAEYVRYTSKREYFAEYLQYQRRYRVSPRESDNKLVDLVRAHSQKKDLKAPLRIADLGCSSGNLLYLIRRRFPDSKLFGIDFSHDSVELCRKDPELEGISFDHSDILNLTNRNSFDVVILNVVAVYFDKEEFRLAMKKCYQSLSEGGILVCFDYFHEFDLQHLSVEETSLGHPEGMHYHIRPISWVRDVLLSTGFLSSCFYPFAMTGSLKKPSTDGELYSYTRRLEDGSNLCFRGSLLQPWCHFVAEKRA